VNGKILYEYGQWTTADSENSSNWRELNNLVLVLDRLLRENNMRGSEIFIFTDNGTARNRHSGKARQHRRSCSIWSCSCENLN
jgi:hypothetical protein